MEEEPEAENFFQNRSSTPIEDVNNKVKSEFLISGRCKIPGCEVELLVESQKIYVCKDLLAHKCRFFQTLFYEETDQNREQNQFQIDVSFLMNVFMNQHVSLEEMLIFLECVMLKPKKPIPAEPESIIGLIKSAYIFKCAPIQNKIAKRILLLMTEYISSEHKLSLLQTADKYRTSDYILESCVRLCASLSQTELKSVSGKVSGGVIGSIYALKCDLYMKQILETLKCPDCGSLQILHEKATTTWLCAKCGTFGLAYLLQPTIDMYTNGVIDRNLMVGP